MDPKNIFADMPILEAMNSDEMEIWQDNDQQNAQEVNQEGDRISRQEAMQIEKEKSNENPMNRTLDEKDYNGEGYRCLSAAQASSRRFKGYRFMAEFLIKNVEYPDGLYPDDILKNIFEEMINQLKNGCKEMGIDANHFIINFNSSLMDHSVPLHLHKLDADACEVLLHKFRTIDQSGEEKGKDSLITQSFLIDATAYDLPPPKWSKKESKKRRYPGRGKGKKIDVKKLIFEHNINQKALLNCENDDNLCLFRAFELLRRKVTLTTNHFNQYMGNEQKQNEDVLKMLEWCEIPDDEESYDVTVYGQRIQEYYDEKFPNKFKLMAFSYAGTFEPFWRSEPGGEIETVLSVLYDEEEEHYVPIINVGKLLKGSNFFCYACEEPYSRASKHKTNCKNRCMGCRRVAPNMPCKKDGGNHFCDLCNKNFNSRSCYLLHKKTTEKGNSICKQYKCCSKCKIHYRVRFAKPRNEGEERRVIPHRCEEHFCRLCFGTHAPRNCYIKKLEPKKEEKPVRMICFDFECQTPLKPDPKLMSFKHDVNFAYCHVFCSNCLKDGTWDQKLDKPCKICGPTRLYSWSPFAYEKTQVDEMHITEDPLADFVYWLLTNFMVDKKKGRKRKRNDDGEEEEEKKEVETLVFSHFGGRYDNILIMGDIIRNAGLIPDMTRQGNKLYQMIIRKNGVVNPTIFRDSYNLIPMRLANFVDTFQLDIDGVEGKQWFPYEYNKACNYGKTLPHLPDKADYNADGLLRLARQIFDEWYAENYNTEFNLCEKLAEYCSSDVKILTHGLIKMAQLFREVTGLNILESVTISGACMKYFRTHLKENYLALVPHLGYEQMGKQSTKARRFLKWLAETKEWDIQYVDNGGEKRYRQYLLDGYVENRPGYDGPLAIEVLGCHWHACPTCYAKLGDDDVLSGRRVGDIRQNNVEKCEAIMEEMSLKIFWEHEIDELYEKDTEFRSFMDNCIDTGPINIRDAFFGGRTGPEWLTASAEKSELVLNLNGHPADLNAKVGATDISAKEWLKEIQERKIKMYDFVSLYPSQNFTQSYPINHPKCTIVNKEVNYTKSDDLYKIIDDKSNCLIRSIAKVFIVPPRHIDVTVVPHRFSDDRLLFSLCRKCAQNNKKGKYDPNYFCNHFEDKDRGWVATINSLELAAALNAGYRVTKIYRAYCWENKDMDDGLFKEYVRKFLRLKYISSGWPAEIKNMEGAAQIKAMREYCKKANEEFGIDIRPRDIQSNPGLKFISKLMLNCLWGRFALRNRLSRTVIVNNDAELAQYLNDPRLEFSLIDHIGEHAQILVFRTKDEFIMENPSSNVMVAAWTTACGRVKLLEALQMLMKRKDVRILYMDTDSIAYEYSEIHGDPIKGGMHLGELSDVYPNDEIMEFISGGAKVYTVKLKNNKNGEIRYDQKLKGVTLDIGNSQIFNHQELKRRVLRKINGEEDPPMELDTRNFKITIDGEIHTVHSKKKFQINLNKGVLISEGQIVPYGFSGDLYDSRNENYYQQSNYHYNRRDQLSEILTNRFHFSNPLNYLLHNKYSMYSWALKQIFHLPFSIDQ